MVLKVILRVMKENRKEYVALNFLYYGLVAVSMIYVSFHPEIQEALLGEVTVEFPTLFPSVVEAYRSGNFPLAAALTFSINLVLGSFVYITLPSLIIPFSGVATGAIRAVAWGLLLAPTSPELTRAMIPHSLTLILEGQGYVLAMFAAYVHWKGVFRPRSIGEEKRTRAYVAGMKKTAHTYLLIALVLAVSAIYEAFEVIYLLGTTS